AWYGGANGCFAAERSLAGDIPLGHPGRWGVPSVFLTDTLANPDCSATIARFIPVPGGLIPALHALQHRFGYVDRRLIPELAEAFNVTDAEVHGVITYYPDFRTQP